MRRVGGVCAADGLPRLDPQRSSGLIRDSSMSDSDAAFRATDSVKSKLPDVPTSQGLGPGAPRLFEIVEPQWNRPARGARTPEVPRPCYPTPP